MRCNNRVVCGPRFTAVFQSFDSLFDQIFIFSPDRNPHPLFDAPQLRTFAVLTTKGLLLLASALALRKLARDATTNAIGPAIGILGILALLMAPGSGTYAFVLLWLPVGLLINYFLSQDARVTARAILCSYLLIGFIPYGHLYAFEGHGALTVLAFPRLFLMVAMFVTCIVAICLPRSSSERVSFEIQHR